MLATKKQRKILVIDKNPDVRITIGQYLVSKGYDVVYAEDGEKGLKKAIETHPFAITLDVLLPQKNGWSVLKQLKENPETKDIPVILIWSSRLRTINYNPFSIAWRA